MRKSGFLALSILTVGITKNAVAQEKWDLRKCVEFAWTNNVSVKQADVQARIAAIQLKQDKWAAYPNADFSSGTGVQFGRSIDPTTNLYVNGQTLTQNFGLSTSVMIFNWNRLKNNVIASRLQSDAAWADVDRSKNDIALSIATAYLQALLAKEQIKIAEVQVSQTQEQLNQTRKRVEAGALPDLNVVELESQLARDSTSLITAITTADMNLLQLKAIMNADAAAPFDIVVPDAAKVPLDDIASLQPDLVYQLALKNQPQQRVNNLNLKSLEAGMAATRAQFYPTISAYAGLGDNFANSRRKITDIYSKGYSSAAITPLSQIVNIGSSTYAVQDPLFGYNQANRSFGDMWSGWGTQMDQNFRQNIGISLNVPILNGRSARSNYERSKLNVESAKITIDQADQKLKQDIYQAYVSVVSALQKYNSSKSAVTASQKTYDYSQKRYELGLLGTFELITNQNNLTNAKLNLITAQYDYIFKMKVLEFYKGQGLKL